MHSIEEMHQRDLDHSIGARIKENDKQAVLSILNKGANPDHLITGKKGNIAMLMLAIDRGYHDIAEVLIQHKADPNLLSISEVTGLKCPALYRCVEKYAISNMDSLLKMLLENGADINWTPQDCFTPLTYAISRNNEELVDLLMAYGASPNVGKNDITDAYFMAKRGNLDEMAAKIENMTLQTSAIPQIDQFHQNSIDEKNISPSKRIRI